MDIKKTDYSPTNDKTRLFNKTINLNNNNSN
jgi:hypothetical protein